MRDLRITLIQSPLYWQDPVANLAMFEEKISALEGAQDIILLPEMFTTGFTMNARDFSEPMNLTTFRWMKFQAKKTKAVIAGSFIVRENNQYFNRFLWMQPDGSHASYDKRHLFRMAGEDKVYAPGSDRVIVEWEGWRICPLVCYDLRFPVWSRNVYDPEYEKMDFDVLLYVANWPAPRHEAWSGLLKARAIENVCYCAGVNRVGEDGNGIQYAGGSSGFDMKGQELGNLAQKEGFMQLVLSAEALTRYRTKFPAHLDADRFEIKKS